MSSKIRVRQLGYHILNFVSYLQAQEVYYEISSVLCLKQRNLYLLNALKNTDEEKDNHDMRIFLI